MRRKEGGKERVGWWSRLPSSFVMQVFLPPPPLFSPLMCARGIRRKRRRRGSDAALRLGLGLAKLGRGKGVVRYLSGEEAQQQREGGREGAHCPKIIGEARGLLFRP